MYYNSNKIVISDRTTGLYILEFNDSLIGDFNGDGIINIIDVIDIVNIILANGEYDPLADLNQDGVIDIIDIIDLVNIILGEE